MKRVGDRYVEATWDEAISDIASRLRAIMDRHGPDATGAYWGNPAGFSSSNPMFMVGFMDAIKTHSRYFVGSVDQNNFHVVADALYGSQLLTLVPDVDACKCEVPVAQIADVARRFALAPSAMCLTHTGVSQNATGTIGEWFGHLLNIVTGRVDRPGGRRFERGYVDSVKVFGQLAKPLEGTSRLRGLPAVAGYHALAELPDEIMTPGPGQIRAMIIDAGNPVVSGPNGAALDEALASLELLVAVDLVQRESHRHAHWLIPGAHWLERSDLHSLTSQLQDEPFAQYGHQAVEPPPGVRQEWEFFTDLALAMGVPLFGYKGVNGFIKASRRLAHATERPGLAFNPEWIDHLLVMSGRRLKYRDIKKHPHGIVFGQKEFGHLRTALRTPDKKIQAGSPALFAEARRRLATPPPAAPEGYPLVLSNRRHHDSMNSWLNELPGLHKHRRTSEVEIHPVAFGVNRNALVNSTDLDPLSQVSPLNSTWVRVDPVEVDATSPVGEEEEEEVTSGSRA